MPSPVLKYHNMSINKILGFLCLGRFIIFMRFFDRLGMYFLKYLCNCYLEQIETIIIIRWRLQDEDFDGIVRHSHRARERFMHFRSRRTSTTTTTATLVLPGRTAVQRTGRTAPQVRGHRR